MVGGGEEYVLKMVILKINWIERILGRVVKNVFLNLIELFKICYYVFNLMEASVL